MTDSRVLTKTREEYQRDIAIQHVRQSIHESGSRSRRANRLYMAVGALLIAALWRDEAAGPLTLTVSELDLFLDGSALVGRCRSHRPRSRTFRLPRLLCNRRHLTRGVRSLRPFSPPHGIAGPR